MIDLMFAAALSGMRASEAAENEPAEALDLNLQSAAFGSGPADADWTVPRQYFDLKEERDCPVFFQKDLPGFGILRVTPPCETGPED